ncbi:MULTISPECIES: serine/threonine-protein kinase [Actinoalloteichus]|uniref:non-specific serine/threonine protein kinase n=1 Tax=Actinoalloteichus caeruleus DSM 43889 TaxID=1120930 RepID=A0ABT1JBF8_ACTCY|nr:serine/threonine-protein kinase [Actinoalloteichus caeruleus]MCP2329778.1 Serine/threonine protein kinase [Actinoalloteichus caeruleus DSM 43889]
MIAGHYRLLERVGSGAMGVVWQAHDERLDRMVAIKQLLLRPELTAQETEMARRRAMREARIAARLQHPNAIAIFDVAEHNGDPCLVIEFLESRSLAAVLDDRGSLPPEEVALIGSQVAAALAAAHAAGIVHRDIKPGNILIDYGGVAKITDFGISRVVGDVTVTQTGMVAGTPAYLAPEVARGQDPAPASDVFALGITLYQAVEGRSPYPEAQNQNPLALLHAVAAGRLDPPSEAAGPLTSVLTSLLQSEAIDRPTMRKASEALAAVAKGGAAPWMPQSVAPAKAAAAPIPPETKAEKTREAPTPIPAETRATTRPGAAGGSAGGDGGGVNAKVMVIAAVVVLVLGGGIAGIIMVNNATGDSGENAAPSSSQSADEPAPGEDEEDDEGVVPDAEELEEDFGDPIEEGTETSATVNQWGSVGPWLQPFFASPGSDTAWNMLTPRAQEMYGGREGFAQYWSENATGGSYQGIHGEGVTGDNAGRLSVTLNYVGGGSERVVVRVVQVGGQYRIDSIPVPL